MLSFLREADSCIHVEKVSTCAGSQGRSGRTRTLPLTWPAIWRRVGSGSPSPRASLLELDDEPPGFPDATARCSVASAQDAPASRVVHGGRCGRVRGGATTEGCGHADESPLRKSPFGSFEAPAVPACRRIRVAHASEQRGGIAGAAWVQRSPQRPLAGPVANGQSRGRLLAARLRHVARQEPVLALGPRGVVCDPGHQRVSARRGVSVRVLVASQAWECSETEVVDACWK